jgi:hypothetical protein
MICYRDMTFCPHLDCQNAEACPRALTDKVREDAKEFGLDICQFVSHPGCYSAPWDKVKGERHENG